MRRYPGNHTDSELLSVPRFLKTRPGAPQTHLAYITDSEANLLQENKPGTPHGGPHGIPNYDSWEYQTAREEQQAYARETGQSTQQAASSLGTSYSAPSNQQEQQQEREHDRQTQIQTNIRDEQQRKAQQKRDIINKQKQAEMAKAQKLAYSTQTIGGVSKQVSNFHNLTDSQLQFLIDSGFAASEASGVLGGVSGMEAEMNKLKKLALTGNKQEREDAYRALDRLNKGEKITDYQLKSFGYDPSGMRTWGDVESDPYLYKAHSDLLSSDLTPDKYRDYMKKISSFGHGFPTAGGDGGGGWGSYGYGGGYGGGGGGGGGGYYDSPAGMPRGNPNELWGAQNPLQQMMISLHGGQGFQQGFARGGIVSLVT